MEDLSGGDVEEPDAFFRMQRAALADENRREGDPDAEVFDSPDSYREEAEEFALSLIHAVHERREEIDGDISRAASNWSLERIGPIERNAIRVALAEFARGETPTGVVIDEAVELAKRFGDRDSGSFVNGVVDRLAGGRGGKGRTPGGEG
jgi:N utilization substance protein B